MKTMHHLLAGILLIAATSASAVTIDFDSLEVNNNTLNQIAGGVYTEDGFTISGTPMYYAGQNHYEYAGSAGMHFRSGGAAISLVDSTSNVFSIDSIGLSILNPNGVSPAVTFTGHLFGGGTVTQSFQPLTFGFTDFFFDPAFSSLVSLTWNQGCCDSSAHQFDDIVLNVTSVPEPGTLALLGLGLVGVGVSRRRRAA